MLSLETNLLTYWRMLSLKKKQLPGIAVISIIILLGSIYVYRINKKPLTYINAINKVYSSNISGMVFNIFKTNNLYGRNEEIIFVGGGNKENNFSADSKEGVKLWETKQLFLSIENLKVLRKGMPEILEPHDTVYYMIQTNQDFYGRDSDLGIYSLALFVNPENYHIYLPRDYYEPIKLRNLTTEYIEYESNEIVKKLINDIITQ
jgi:hypothetical protein